MKPSLAFLTQHVVPALVFFGLAFGLSCTSVLQRVENVTVDERTRFRAWLGTTTPADELAVVGIDSPSLREFGRWPWPRDQHGDFLQLLARVRPSVVAWDILFTEPTEQDEYFATQAVRNRAVILAAEQADPSEGGVTPGAAVKAGARLVPLPNVDGDRSQILSSPGMLVPVGKLAAVTEAGFVDTPPSDDGVRRVAPMVVRVGDQVYPTLALRTLMAYWGATGANVTVRLGDAIVIDAPLAHRRIPIDSAGGYTINYRHDLGGFNWWSYAGTFNALSHRLVDRQPSDVPPMTGRMILVGQVAEGLADLGPTPFSALTPLVLVHANVIENILREDYVRRPSTAWIWLGALAIGVIGLARFSNRTPREQAVFALGVPVAFVAGATLLWINGSWLVPVIGPLVGFAALQVFMIGRRMLTELHAKQQITGMFGTYVSPELVSQLVAAGKPPELGGHEEEITAFFSDIQDFSTFSEILPPPRLVELMNEYLTACTDIVQGEGGALDKYIGDAIVAMFGAPVPLPDHAYRACVASIRMQQRLDELRTKWRTDGNWPEIVGRLRSRIGLNTGECVIGNMGSRTRFNYTMMGDNVNLAARMESGAKSWGTFVMCTETTRLACEAHSAAIAFRPLGRIQVKGRSAAVPFHEIAGFADALSDSAKECFSLFAQALARYYERDWDGAETLFRRSATLEPLTPAKSPGVKTSPSLVYLDRVEQCRAVPPPENWDGVYVMHEK